MLKMMELCTYKIYYSIYLKYIWKENYLNENAKLFNVKLNENGQCYYGTQVPKSTCKQTNKQTHVL